MRGLELEKVYISKRWVPVYKYYIFLSSAFVCPLNKELKLRHGSNTIPLWLVHLCIDYGTCLICAICSWFKFVIVWWLNLCTKKQHISIFVKASGYNYFCKAFILQSSWFKVLKQINRIYQQTVIETCICLFWIS